MAKKTTENFNLSVSLTSDQVGSLVKIHGEEGVANGIAVADMAMTLLSQLSRGGVMVSPEDLEVIRQSTGVEFTSGDELIPLLSQATGMEEGKHCFKLLVDPEYYAALQEISEYRGTDVNTMIQEAVDTAQANGWFDAVPDTRVTFLVMRPEDKMEVEGLIGKSFNTGQELLSILRSMREEPTSGLEGLFADSGSEVPA